MKIIIKKPYALKNILRYTTVGTEYNILTT